MNASKSDKGVSSKCLAAWCGAVFMLFSVFAASAQADPTAFFDDFNSPVLDAAWGVAGYTGPLPRSHGQSTPANGYSLSANPGRLRYLLYPVTHDYGFLNGYQTIPGGTRYDPGLEIFRTFSGERWLLETLVHYFTPLSNGKAQVLRIYFGDGGPGTYFLSFRRHEDLCCGAPNNLHIELDEKFGPAVGDITGHAHVAVPAAAGDRYYLRVERDGGILKAMWSLDGLAWTTAFTKNMAGLIDGLAQRVTITGNAWFTPNGSYADYDYVSLADLKCIGAASSVTKLEVISDAGEVLGELVDGTIIVRQTVAGPVWNIPGVINDAAHSRRFSVRAVTNPPTVGSVRFELNYLGLSDSFLVRNAHPYQFDQNMLGLDVPHELEVVPYQCPNRLGLRGQRMKVNFSQVRSLAEDPASQDVFPAVGAPRALQFALFSDPAAAALNNENQYVTRIIDDGDVLCPTEGAACSDIGVSTFPTVVGSVRFEIDDRYVPIGARSDNFYPYHTECLDWIWTPGIHEIEASPYPNADRRGTRGQPLKIHYTVPDGCP